MSNGNRSAQGNRASAFTVCFGDKFQKSGQFDAIFKQGMALVERTAGYLDGKGRRDSKRLEGTIAVAYATESMRLTTRLLELSSWLLIRRAVRDGEITVAEARRRRERVKLSNTGRPSHIRHWTDLPEELRGLIEESFTLQDRILQLDQTFDAMADAADLPPKSNPVAAQLARLESAFGARLRSTDIN